MGMKQTDSDYEENSRFVLEMQPIAIAQFYSQVWPGHKVIELDNDRADHLKAILDIGGADKMLRAPNGSISFLGQRFRRYRSWHPVNGVIYDDFTLRCKLFDRYDSEMEKLRNAMAIGSFVATWYAYGHSNANDTGFAKFRIVRFPLLLQYLISGKIPYTYGTNAEGRPFLKIPFRIMPRPVFLLDYPNYQLSMLSEVKQ